MKPRNIVQLPARNMAELWAQHDAVDRDTHGPLCLLAVVAIVIGFGIALAAGCVPPPDRTAVADSSNLERPVVKPGSGVAHVGSSVRLVAGHGLSMSAAEGVVVAERYEYLDVVFIIQGRYLVRIDSLPRKVLTVW